MLFQGEFDFGRKIKIFPIDIVSGFPVNEHNTLRRLWENIGYFETLGNAIFLLRNRTSFRRPPISSLHTRSFSPPYTLSQDVLCSPIHVAQIRSLGGGGWLSS